MAASRRHYKDYEDVGEAILKMINLCIRSQGQVHPQERMVTNEQVRDLVDKINDAVYAMVVKNLADDAYIDTEKDLD